MKKIISFLLVSIMIISMIAFSGCSNSISDFEYDDSDISDNSDSNSDGDNGNDNINDNGTYDDSYNDEDYYDEPSDLPHEELIVGKWTADIDITSVITEMFKKQYGDATLDEGAVLKFTIVHTYKENGKLEMEIPEDTIDQFAENYKIILVDMLAESLEKKALEEGRTLQQALEARGYSSLDEMVDYVMKLMSFKEMLASLSNISGSEEYYFENGKLVTVSNKNKYIHTYELSKNTLKLIDRYKGENNEKVDSPIYPMVLRRIG